MSDLLTQIHLEATNQGIQQLRESHSFPKVRDLVRQKIGVSCKEHEECIIAINVMVESSLR